MYMYSRNILKKSVYILMIKLADTIEYKLCERCKTWYGVNTNQSTKVVITKVIIQNFLLLWLKLEQAKFELFFAKSYYLVTCVKHGKLLDTNVVIMWL